MKAISLHQPWASAVAVGAKRIETRSWPTRHRGTIAIHAAKHRTIMGLIGVKCSWTWCAVLRPLGVRMGGDERLEDLLPFGAIVAVANLVDCRPTDSFTNGDLDRLRGHAFETRNPNLADSWTERGLGDFSLGRYGYVLDDVRALETPILARGFQRIWNLDPATAADVEDQLPLPTNDQALAGRRRLPG